MDRRRKCRKSSLPLPVKTDHALGCHRMWEFPKYSRQEIPHSQCVLKSLVLAYEQSYSNPVNPNRFPASPSRPSVLHFQRTPDFISSSEQGCAGLLLITCGQAPGTVCSTGRWLLIARHFSLCFSGTGATIWQMLGAKRRENNAYSQWHTWNFEADSQQVGKNCRSWKHTEHISELNVKFKWEVGKKTMIYLLLFGFWVNFYVFFPFLCDYYDISYSVLW